MKKIQKNGMVRIETDSCTVVSCCTDKDRENWNEAEENGELAEFKRISSYELGWLYNGVFYGPMMDKDCHFQYYVEFH